jgi:hypothetical protein
MAERSARLERVIEEMTGNESLLQMLDTDAATELLNWGIATARSILSRTQELDDFAADLAILPRLKAIRQAMRSIGNWSAGKYVDPESRIQLRDKLLGHFRTIFGERRELPSAAQLDELLSKVDPRSHTPHQLILELREMLEQRG